MEPNDITRDLKRKKVRGYDYPDSIIAIKHDELALPFAMFDKVRQVKQADIVSNKRLEPAMNDPATSGGELNPKRD